MPAIPFHQHPMRHELMARAPELAAAVMQRSQRDGKRWDRAIETDTALAVFEHLAANADLGGQLRAVIVNDSHFFAYTVSPMWFAPGENWLIEQFFIRVERGLTDAALAEIDQLGRDNGCRWVLMATMLAANDAALGRLLERHGYAPHSSQYLKELC